MAMPGCCAHAAKKTKTTVELCHNGYKISYILQEIKIKKYNRYESRVHQYVERKLAL